ncbi:MAG: hypothetical protein Q9162_000951 [Coniocarpon cinnabarinum]
MVRDQLILAHFRPVGSGKTALMLALCQRLRDTYSLAAVTNDIFTREDRDFLLRHSALPTERLTAIETGGCPHAAVREDISSNLLALTSLHNKHGTDILLIESGGDNLAANYSRELADFIIYVIDVAGGDKVPRKGGPGITQSDLLVVNKIDLAEAVGADLGVMERESAVMREGGPTIFAEVKNGKNVDHIEEDGSAGVSERRGIHSLTVVKIHCINGHSYKAAFKKYAHQQLCHYIDRAIFM